MTLDQILQLRPFLGLLAPPGRFVSISSNPLHAEAVALTSDGLAPLERAPKALLVAAIKAGLLARHSERPGVTLYRLTEDGQSMLRLVREHTAGLRRRLEAARADLEAARDELSEVVAAGGASPDAPTERLCIEGLTRLQAVIVRTLEDNMGHPVARDFIYQRMCAAGSNAIDVKLVDVQLSHIRRRRPDLRARIRTIWGGWLQMDPEPLPALAEPSAEPAPAQ